MHLVVEQILTEQGMQYIPVSAQPRTALECWQDAHILNQRFREDELESRLDWERRESTWPITAQLKNFGDRRHERIFTIRRVCDVQ